MKVGIVGAGMVGVAAAQALAAQGHQVTVYERRSSVAEETSFAPSGIAASGLAAPWIAPPGRWRAPWSRREDALRLRETGAAFSRGSGRRGAAQATRLADRALALHRLLRAGIERIDELARSLALEFESDRGLLLTLGDAATIAQAEIAVEWLRQAGETAEWVDAEEQRRLEPGRAVAEDAPRAVYLPAARTGNAREWTQLLRGHAQANGVRFLFQHEVAGVIGGPEPAVLYATAAESARGDTTLHETNFDAVVVCAALDSQRLLEPLGVKLAWRPVRGWSVTVPLHLRETLPHVGPRAALLDVRSGIAITRLGSRVRVAGGHEVGAAAPGDAPPDKALQPLYDALDEGFPGAALWKQAQSWAAARPALDDGLPAVGACGVDGVWLNVGHAHHGWPLSQVAAEALCAMMSGQAPRVDVGALAPQRFA
jgi:D-amino-acid dehydrogenase